MILYLKDEEQTRKLTLSSEDLIDMYLDEGEEGTVYKYDAYALKVYHPNCRKVRIDEKTCERLMELRNLTYLVQMPQGMILNQMKSFNGYYTYYVLAHCLQEIYSLPMRIFTGLVKDVYRELSILSDHHISVCDFHLGNFCYDGNFNFVDPGSYELEDELSYVQLLTKNQTEFSRFITEDLLALLMFPHKKKRQKMIDHFEGIEYLPDILEDESDGKETVKKYIKRIID